MTYLIGQFPEFVKNRINLARARFGCQQFFVTDARVGFAFRRDFTIFAHLQHLVVRVSPKPWQIAHILIMDFTRQKR
jgi:hypothetical protein